MFGMGGTGGALNPSCEAERLRAGLSGETPSDARGTGSIERRRLGVEVEHVKENVGECGRAVDGSPGGPVNALPPNDLRSGVASRLCPLCPVKDDAVVIDDVGLVGRLFDALPLIMPSAPLFRLGRSGYRACWL